MGAAREHATIDALSAADPALHPQVVMEIVGHSAIEMTMNVYGHVNLKTQHRALDGLDDELSGRARAVRTAVSGGQPALR